MQQAEFMSKTHVSVVYILFGKPMMSVSL